MLYLNQCGIVCALGTTHSAIKSCLFEYAQTGLALSDAYSPGRQIPLGQVDAALPSMEAWPIAQRSRNNQLALAALAQIRPAVDAAIARFGSDRVGIVIGTSTSGIADTESAIRQYVLDGTFPADFHYAQQEMGSPASMLSVELGISGPAYVHSSACSSSAKAMASAASVTVSMAALSKGTCNVMLLVSCVLMFTSRGNICE